MIHKNKFAVITGATSGIGWATAEAFADLNINLVLCGRRLEKLEELEAKLSGKVRVVILVFDVSNREEVQLQLNSLPVNISENITILINNAGGAHGLEPIQEGSYKDWDLMVDANVKGLLYVSEMIMPMMIQNRNGHIINMSSIAGKEVYAKGNVYCASKHAVEAISSGMRIDLNPYGIKVTNVAPGAVNTEFSSVRFKQNAEKIENVYKGFEPLVAKDIADTLVYIVSTPKNVMIADITILPVAQASTTVFNKAF